MSGCGCGGSAPRFPSGYQPSGSGQGPALHTGGKRNTVAAVPGAKTPPESKQ